MSLTAAAIRLLGAKGLTVDEIADVAEANSASKVDVAAEKRRAYDRERKRKSTGVPVEVYSDHSTGISTGVPPETASRDARVRDITSNSENIIISSAASDRENVSEIDWPEGDKPSRAYCEELEAALRDAAGASINAAAPNLQSVASILALSRAGKGPPCDLQVDVLPTIRICAAKTSPGHAERWDYFVPAIRQARDRRLAGAPAAGAFGGQQSTGPPSNSFTAQRSAEQAEVRRRVMESENG